MHATTNRRMQWDSVTRSRKPSARPRKTSARPLATRTSEPKARGDRVKGGVGQIVDNAKEKLGDVASGVADKVEEAKDKLTGK